VRGKKRNAAKLNQSGLDAASRRHHPLLHHRRRGFRGKERRTGREIVERILLTLVEGKIQSSQTFPQKKRNNFAE